MIYQIIAKEKQNNVEDMCDSCVLIKETYMKDFNKEKGYNFIDEERFSTDLVDTKFRYLSNDDVIVLRLAISSFNTSVGEEVINLIELK